MQKLQLLWEKSEGAIKSLYHRTLLSLRDELRSEERKEIEMLKIVTDGGADMPAEWLIDMIFIFCV